MQSMADPEDPADHVGPINEATPDTKKSYEVGYCKPPVHTRFQPNQSGNRRGRPRGAKGLKSEIRAELAERVTVSENGKSRRLSKRRVIIKALTAMAAKGDVRASDKLLSLIIQMEGFEDERPERRALSEVELRILDHLLNPGADDSVEGLSEGERDGIDDDDGYEDED
jgi:hypothetical protein